MRDKHTIVTWTLVNLLVSVVSGVFSSKLLSFSSHEAYFATFIAFTSLSIFQLVCELYTLKGSLGSSFERARNELTMDSRFREICTSPELRESIEHICEVAFRGVSKAGLAGEHTNVYNLFRNEIFRTLQECENSISQVSGGVIRIEKEKSVVFWSQIVDAISSSYRTTNLVTSESDSFGQSDNRARLEMQEKATKRLGKKCFSRIFIYESEALLKEKLPLIERQRAIGIDVKTISLKAYNEIGQEQWSPIIGCSDFAIIDDRFVYITVVDDTTKRSAYVELIDNPVRLEAAKTLFDLVLKNCDDLEEK